MFITTIGIKDIDRFIVEHRRVLASERKDNPQPPVENPEFDHDNCVYWIGAGSRGSSHGGVIRRTDKYGILKSKKPARYVWEQIYHPLGPAPGMEIGHTCENIRGLCINSKHTIEGHREAIYILHSALGRLAKKVHTHCKKGHELSRENLVLYTAKTGERNRRRCKICVNRVSREGNRRRNGAKARVKIEHPDLSNRTKLCGNGIHRMNYENTCVYWCKADNRWYRNCRKCNNLRGRIKQRRLHGFNPSPKYQEEVSP